jgi:hypothetical protein
MVGTSLMGGRLIRRRRVGNGERRSRKLWKNSEARVSWLSRA